MSYVIAFIVVAIGRFGFGLSGTTSTFVLALIGFGLGCLVEHLLKAKEVGK